MKFTILLISGILKCVIGQQLKNHAVADKNGTYHIFWSVDGENIIFEVQVATKGYVGFGFSPNGGMPGSDVIIGWVLPNGQAYFHDRHAIAFSEPLIDTQQNYYLLNAFENDTHTVLRFTRKLNTCDKENDFVITDSTVKLIYSWHPEDPQNITGLLYHGPNRRGAKSILLLSPKNPTIEITDDITIWDIQMPNVTIPAQLTTYWCMGLKLPPLNEPHYYIGFEILISLGNENYVHHFGVYECRGDPKINEEKFQQRRNGYECAKSGEVAEPMDCQPELITQAAGAQGHIFPKDVGRPLGEEYGGPSYFLLQMHYNNVGIKQGIVDSTIIRAYLTKKEVTHKANSVTMYANFDYTLLIPPQQPAFKVAAYCPPECTSKAFPKEGINVFSVGVHTHLVGIKLSLRHFRGNTELQPIAVEDNYDFNYQEMRMLPQIVKVLPGDMLLGTCVYSSMDRNETVVGGYGTDEEMCFFYFYYYPIVDLTVCIGGPSFKDISNYFGVEEIAEDNFHVIAPVSLQNRSMFELIKHYDWSTVDDTKLKAMASLQYDAVKNFTCIFDPKKKASYIEVPIGYPTSIPPYTALPDECDAPNGSLKSTTNDYTPKKTSSKTSSNPLKVSNMYYTKPKNTPPKTKY